MHVSVLLFGQCVTRGRWFEWLPLSPLQVKADKDSANLQSLQKASRGVTQATAAVVASTKSGKSQIEEKGEKVRSVWVTGLFRGVPELQVVVRKVFEHPFVLCVQTRWTSPA